MVGIKEVLENDDIVVVTIQGIIIRQPAKTIRVAGRNTQGVRLIRLEGSDKIAAVAVVPSEDDKEIGPEEGATEVAPPAQKEKAVEVKGKKTRGTSPSKKKGSKKK